MVGWWMEVNTNKNLERTIFERDRLQDSSG